MAKASGERRVGVDTAHLTVGHSEPVERPPRPRRLAVVAIDLAVLLLALPVLVLMVGWAMSWAFYLPVRDDCPVPCDGPAMLGFGLALVLLYVVWLAYYPVLAFWRRRTVGARLMRLRFDGSGLRRRLVWDSARDDASA